MSDPVEVPPKYGDDAGGAPTGAAAYPAAASGSPPPTPPPPAGVTQSTLPSCDPTAGGAEPADREAELKTMATSTMLPEWRLRLSNALMQECELDVDLEKIVAAGPQEPKARLKTLRTLLVGAKGAMEQGLALAKQESTLPVIEAVVQAVELACADATVRGDVAAKIKRVVFEPCDPEAKLVNIADGALVYRGAFGAGQPGVFSKKEVVFFLEDQFYAQERALVNRFAADGLPRLIERLQQAVGAPVKVNIDVPGMLATCTEKVNRLPTARTIITRTKLTDKGIVAASSALSKLSNTVNELASKANSRPPPPKVEAPEKEPVNSPNVLLPLVEAFEFCCSQHETVRAAIAAVIGTVTFTMSPGSDLVATLNLHQAMGEPVVAPSPIGTPPIQGGVLVYNGCFEAGHKGCFTKQNIIDILEAHFRCQEKGYVHRLMEMTVPEANGRLSSVMGKPVEIEVQWTTIFREGLTTSQRLDVVEALAAHNSQFVIQPMVQAISTVVQKIDEAVPAAEVAAGAGPPDNPVKSRIARIVICGIAGGTAKPSLALHPLQAGEDKSMALMYTCALERGPSGCYDVGDFKAALRGMFGIETPADEKGVNAMLSKGADTVTKVTADLTKKLGKMKFW